LVPRGHRGPSEHVVLGVAGVADFSLAHEATSTLVARVMATSAIAVRADSTRLLMKPSDIIPRRQHNPRQRPS
jgi:hypothetical protein